MTESDIMLYKKKITKRIWNIPDVVTLINNPNVTMEEPDKMVNVNLFSFIKVPNFVQDDKNYICFDVNSRILSRNEVLKTVTINVVIFCKDTSIKTNYGNRHDVLGGVIIDSFNWSDFLGFELELISDTESYLENEYHARTLQFKNLMQNSLSNGVKMDGY